jgi:hypothetical protein
MKNIEIPIRCSPGSEGYFCERHAGIGSSVGNRNIFSNLH